MIATLALSGGTPARAQQAAVIGGIGGRYFEFTCSPGQVVVGLRGSAGVLLDNIQAICGRVVPGGSYADASVQGPVFGNNRAQDNHVECPANYAVTSLWIKMNQFNPHVGYIAIRCTELSHRRDGGSTTVEIRGSGELERYSTGGTSDCDSNFATGIRGRAQEYLTAIGLLCGAAVVVAEPGPPKILNKRKKSSVAEKYPWLSDTTPAIPQTQKTLNKRKRPGTWGAPPPEQQTGGAGSASINSDGNVNAYTKSNAWTGSPPESSGNTGASLNSDGGSGMASAAPPQAAPASQGASPLINGMYATVVSITDSRCLFSGDMRGSGQRDLEINPQPHIRIPLHEYSGVFGGPVNLNVDGLRLSQSTTIPMQFGPMNSPVPANFEGAFTPDGNSFDVRFRAGTDFCRVSGTIHGSRN